MLNVAREGLVGIRELGPLGRNGPHGYCALYINSMGPACFVGMHIISLIHLCSLYLSHSEL